MEEIWKDIPEYEGFYQASNYGRIKSLYHNIILKQAHNEFGYAIVHLVKNKKSRMWRVHRLVWLAFNGNIPEGMEINHIDENKDNNRINNLELLSHKDNMNYGTRLNRQKIKLKQNKISKPVIQYSTSNIFIKEWLSLNDIEKELGYFKSNICTCCSGRYKQAYGYIWRYK